MLPAPTELMREPALLIGGQRVTDSSGGRFRHVYAATGTATGDVPQAGITEIDDAVRGRETPCLRGGRCPATSDATC